jgi:hypothetical protein
MISAFTGQVPFPIKRRPLPGGRKDSAWNISPTSSIYGPGLEKQLPDMNRLNRAADMPALMDT